MKLAALEGNSQRLDGGAMFGNCPRELWKRWVEVDERNRIPLACRCLLFRLDDGRNVLFEVGAGSFFEPKMRERYGIVEEEHVLLNQLKSMALTHEDINAIVLSHLHFDHVGGLVDSWDGGDLKLLFPNAKIYVSQRQWEHANNPHRRDRASYVQEIHELMDKSGRLELIDGTSHPALNFGVRFEYYDGHTPGMMVSRIALPGGPLYFTADLIPGLPWMHLPISMGYDRFPELTVDEKTAFLEKAEKEDAKLFLTHDPAVSCSGIARDKKGNYTGYAFSLQMLMRPLSNI